MAYTPKPDHPQPQDLSNRARGPGAEAPERSKREGDGGAWDLHAGEFRPGSSHASGG